MKEKSKEKKENPVESKYRQSKIFENKTKIDESNNTKIFLTTKSSPFKTKKLKNEKIERNNLNEAQQINFKDSKIDLEENYLKQISEDHNEPIEEIKTSNDNLLLNQEKIDLKESSTNQSEPIKEHKKPRLHPRPNTSPHQISQSHSNYPYPYPEYSTYPTYYDQPVPNKSIVPPYPPAYPSYPMYQSHPSFFAQSYPHPLNSFQGGSYPAPRMGFPLQRMQPIAPYPEYPRVYGHNTSKYMDLAESTMEADLRAPRGDEIRRNRNRK